MKNQEGFVEGLAISGKSVQLAAAKKKLGWSEIVSVLVSPTNKQYMSKNFVRSGRVYVPRILRSLCWCPSSKAAARSFVPRLPDIVMEQQI
jgi:hypothetical protein